MSLVDDVIAKLKTIEVFEDRVYGAVDLADLIAKNILPPKLPAAFVVPGGEDPGAAVSMTGIQTQLITETVSVVMIDRKSGDSKGDEGRKRVTVIRDATRDALLGWTPGDGFEAMTYRQSRFVDMVNGAVFLQSDFSSVWQHRAAHT